MLSLMPLAPFFACAAYVLCMAKLVTAAYDAPIGYEDAEGFHYGIPVRAGVRS
ncbi:hypothetical protein [Opitutus terrae]|uniref:hypothetical protein n=1 Tax=Opitutus terrae TaxID=107709 RepID=UPI0003257BEE|nr:hypothetical protein [Opitutus terrae]